MIRLEMKNYNMISTERQPYHQAKLISMNILLVKKYYRLYNNKPITTKEIYDKLLDERMDEILEMSREINYDNLVYNFKDQTPLISFIKFGDPVYTYDQLKE